MKITIYFVDQAELQFIKHWIKENYTAKPLQIVGPQGFDYVVVESVLFANGINAPACSQHLADLAFCLGEHRAATKMISLIAREISAQALLTNNEQPTTKA